MMLIIQPPALDFARAKQAAKLDQKRFRQENPIPDKIETRLGFARPEDLPEQHGQERQSRSITERRYTRWRLRLQGVKV